MRPIDDSSFLTPDERLAEVAGILATSVLRLHTRVALSFDVASRLAPKNLAESGTSCLEVSEETVLSVHKG